VVVVGAGLGGLACALHLAGAGREVTVVEREPHPGGRAGVVERQGFRFDTGPTVFTMPELLAEAFAAVGEDLGRWVEFTRLDPAYRAFYPDGSTLDVVTDPARMAAEVARVCGPAEADGYLRFVDYTKRLWELEKADFIDRNFDSPRDLVTLNLLRLLRMGAFRRLGSTVDRFFADERTRRIFSFQAMYAGVSPQKALSVYAVIAYLDCVTGVYFPAGGMHAVPAAMAAAAEKHGAVIRYGTTVSRVETTGGRATAVITDDGERIPADVVVLNPDLEAAHALLPGGGLKRRLRYSPSCVVVHVGSRVRYGKTSHHNIHFGQAWRRTFREIIDEGTLMSDPSLLVTNPTFTDPGLAPPDRQVYYVLAPVPNQVIGRQNWDAGLTRSYTSSLMEVLEARGYPGFGEAAEVVQTVTPADWAAAGLRAGTPFAAAHTFTQTGPFRPGNLHPTLSNVVLTGSGTRPGVGIPMVLVSGKLAAARVTGLQK
jgi:phytoene desaturase